MARLNEPALAGESLDSLKRRFVRQNRELARSNSNQSMKIRNLETQISQLVAQNVSLRGDIIQLQSELDASRGRNLAENVDAVKRKLEQKLHEFGGLAAELNDVGKRSQRRRISLPRSPRQSPEKKPGRRASGICDVLEGREGWLPTITEGKHFPRKTLEPIEIRNLVVNESSDSPEIGPPPRTSIDDPNSINHDSDSKQSNAANLDEETSAPSLLSTNLETRRKRRESNVRLDSTMVNGIDPSTSKESNSNRPSELWTTQPIRAGAKRKLDVANRPYHAEKAASENTDDFICNEERSHTASKQEQETQKSPVRKALAPKLGSVNLSPRKITISEKPQDKPSRRQHAKVNLPKSYSHKTSNPGSLKVQEVPEAVESIELALDSIKLEPKTPAPLDLLSPTSTEASGSRADGRGDTPPPMDLTSRTGVGIESANAGRGSRRARASVNYAEPNLISKMRRPTKDLVDAVKHEQSRPTSESMEPPDTKQENSSQKPPLRIAEAGNDNKVSDEKSLVETEDKRPEPQSPLEKKEEASNAPAFDRSTTRDRRRSALYQTAPYANQAEQGGSSAVISALTGGAIRKSSSTSIANQEGTSLEDAVKRLDIFDVERSPPTAFSLAKAKDKTESNRPSSASSVRSTGSNSDKKARQPPVTSSSSSSSSSTLNRPRSRRQTIDGESGITKPSQSTYNLNSGGSRDRGAKPSRSAAGIDGSTQNDKLTTAQKIAERTAARRRSMVL